jgi:2,3-dihydro-2,3-dihydroxybenzoate dehydrogenase
VELTGLSGQTALVTGAAGGIGWAVAAALAAAGVQVIAADLATAGLTELAAGLPAGCAPVRIRPLDIADAQAVEAAVAAIEAEDGPVGLLVNAAGVIGRLGPLLAQEPEEFDRLFAVNVKGPFLTSRAVGRRMAGRGSGCIITIASNSADILRTDQSLYGASKSAVRYLTACLGLELAGHGVRCATVSPGTTNTPMARARAIPGREAVLIAGDPVSFRAGIPLGRLAEPSDIADAVLFLASDQARHITCTTLTVDGGATLRPG